MAKFELIQQLAIQCASHDYPIYIGSHLLSDVELLCRHIRSTQILIVTNDTIAPLYLKQLREAFSLFQCDELILPDGEAYKNQACLSMVYDTLIQRRHHRDTTLVALGGGVIGDITGFAAATYQRGVRFIQVPTTLLAQVDASVGGKTAINHPLGKNMIGSFHQPHAVIMDLTTLQTLNAREFRAGVAEIIKYGLLIGGKFLHRLDKILAQGQIMQSSQALSDLIANCCQVKASFVEKDEREVGERALLNLGHTFAHALESYTHYQRWLHGEAVAIGLYCATLLSHQLGHIDESIVAFVDSILHKAKLPSRIPKEIDLKELHALMLNDKKTMNQALRFVLMRALGECYIETNVTDDQIRHVLVNAVEGA